MMQGDAKTILYAAMYTDGQYTGAISFVSCKEKREWTKEERSQLGELTKIVSAHLARNLAVNASHLRLTVQPGFDPVTGLISFTRFKEETERLILGGYGASYGMAYIDFEDFKHFNRKFGYSAGDELLKNYCGFMTGGLAGKLEVHFSRVVADQFVLFLPCPKPEETAKWLEERMSGLPRSSMAVCGGSAFGSAPDFIRFLQTVSALPLPSTRPISPERSFRRLVRR